MQQYWVPNSYEQLPVLDMYERYIGTGTTRSASEAFACPPQEAARLASIAMCRTIKTLFEARADDAPAPTDDSLQQLKHDYWHMAKRVGQEHTHANHTSLDSYFAIRRARDYATIAAELRRTHDTASVPVVLLDCIDQYISLGRPELDSTAASRMVIRLFATCLPVLEGQANALRLAGADETTASRQAVRYFADAIVPTHLEYCTKQPSNLLARADVIPRFRYPVSNDLVLHGPKQPDMRLSRSDAEGLNEVCFLQRCPYTGDELAYATELAATPAMQRTLLTFHLALVDHAAQYLRQHPERLQHSLEPFSDIFVRDQAGKDMFIPNPKLIRNIVNNILPAVARTLLQRGLSAGALDGAMISQSLSLVPNLHLYETQISILNDYDKHTDTVALSGTLIRACPAARMFNDALAAWLPSLYDSCKSNSDR